MMRMSLLGAAIGLMSSASLAQQADLASNMNCADYLKAEKASGWSSGITGSPAVDQLSDADARRVHDYCTANPQENATAAIRKVKQDPSKDPARRLR